MLTTKNIFIVGSILGTSLTMPSAATAQDPSAQGPAFQISEWNVVCPQVVQSVTPRCFTRTRIQLTNNPKIFTNFSVVKPVDRQLTQLQIMVPLGVDLPSGLSLRINNSLPMQLNYTLCVQNGCLITQDISDTFVASLRNDIGSIDMEFVLPGNAPAKVSIDIEGFSTAYNDMVRQQAATIANYNAGMNRNP